MTNLNRNKISRTAYLASLRTKVQEMSSPNSNQRQDDERYWKLEVDKAKIGSAIIRFLPAKVGEEFPFVQIWSHGFQGLNGKWYIENCPSSLGGLPSDVCPPCKGNTKLWSASKDKEDPLKKIASKRKRKLNYISNILVISDSKHPEHNGKVFLYKYGKKIFEKIKDRIDPPPEFADMTSIDPFDMEEGCDFKLRQVEVDGWPNYDKSSFSDPTSIGDEDMIASIEKQLYSLNEVLDPKHFKSYDDLNKKYLQVIEDSENVPVLTATAKPSIVDDDDMPVVHPRPRPAAAPKPVGRIAKPVEEPADISGDGEPDDYFERLAKQNSK